MNAKPCWEEASRVFSRDRISVTEKPNADLLPNMLSEDE